MRTILCFIHALILTALIAGCVTPLCVELYNNTSDTIFVRVAKKRLVVPARSKIRFEPGIDERTAFFVEVGARSNAYQFNGIPIPKQFCSYKRGCAEHYFQLQSDLKIYIVEPDSSFPVRNLPEQPQGFPLVPVGNVE
jgi:hypothetical protein